VVGVERPSGLADIVGAQGCHIAGSHFNPAVTLAVLIRGRNTTADAVPHWLTQLV
jgi:glycerol uptake facilitator-like aquaporin